MAVRMLTENNKENQKIIRNLRNEGVIQVGSKKEMKLSNASTLNVGDCFRIKYI